MENNLPRTMVLSMKICSCEECPKRLKKKLLKMAGVDSVEVDTENNLLCVDGRIDATTLVNNVAKLGKSVQLVVELKHKNHKTNEGSGSKFAAPEKEEPHKNCCCEDGRHNSEKKVEKKQEHICEAYVPPVIDPRVCRDFHCKTHPRGRVIVDRVPAENTSFFGMGGFQMGDLRYNGGYNPFAGGPFQYPGTQSGWYGQEPPPYGNGWQPQRSRNLPQHPFIFQ